MLSLSLGLCQESHTAGEVLDSMQEQLGSQLVAHNVFLIAHESTEPCNIVEKLEQESLRFFNFLRRYLEPNDLQRVLLPFNLPDERVNLIKELSREYLRVLRGETPVGFAEPGTTVHQLYHFLLLVGKLDHEKLSFLARGKFAYLLLLILECENLVEIA